MLMISMMIVPRIRENTMPPAPKSAAIVDLHVLPGHYVRRLQQIAVAAFMQETADQGLTPVQFAALQTIANGPGLDQRTLAATIAFDTSTIAGVIDRLEDRGLVLRRAAPSDRRVRQLTLTRAGRTLLAASVPGMLRAQERILAPLSRAERAVFMRLLARLVQADDGAPGHSTE
jgi:MarR family transcriptional regulator, lower aerobic nicotinate degradation pathway regulator